MTKPQQLRGAWLLRGTGEVLAISTAGTYAIHDLGSGTSALQVGMVAIERDGSVVFSPMDAPGCTTVYASVISRGNSLDASLADSSCGQLGTTTDTWIRLTED